MQRPALSRRNVLVGATAAVAGVALDAFGIEPHWLRVRRHDVPLPGLPASLEGFSIAQITDAHLTGLGAVEEAIVAALRRARPERIVLTGDLLDHTDRLGDLAELCSQLGELGASVVATLGNWEHWGALSLSELERTYARSGARLLVNDWLDGSETGVALYATDDGLAGTPRLPASTPSAAVEVLMTHSPAYVDEAPGAAREFDLCLSGHTHGGQIRAGFFAPLVPPGSGRFVAGWYDTRMGPLYVSSGTGTSIVPARFCCRPELPIFTLVRG